YVTTVALKKRTVKTAYGT
ncbi:FAD dependent oxidoreductase family protein, partial [Vibrio parahaemolyticus V-223/04]